MSAEYSIITTWRLVLYELKLDKNILDVDCLGIFPLTVEKFNSSAKNSVKHVIVLAHLLMITINLVF